MDDTYLIEIRDEDNTERWRPREYDMDTLRCKIIIIDDLQLGIGKLYPSRECGVRTMESPISARLSASE